MSKYRICLIEGDGIGHEVIPAARRVLEASGLDAEFVSAEAGYEYFLDHGTSVPEATYEAVESTDATLFGAATSPSGEKPNGFFGAIRHLRRKYNLYANVRPTKTRPVPGAYENVDLVIVRENTQGLYVEQERRYGDTAIADTVITKDASERIGRFAIDLALKRRQKLTVVHKSNVLPVTQGLFMNTILDLTKNVEGLNTNTMIVDNAAMQLVRNPTQFDVMVMTNMFGDILSDLAAGLVGGLGIAASGNVGDRFGIFESVHGSAPDIAGQGISNPTATILAAVLMLDHLGAHDVARRIDQAVNTVLAEGPRTRDLGGTAGTKEFTDAVIAQLK
ncbi:isocitrate/isopropylmalate dehydrogenase family protein [Deinococcus metallilatus]|uniref:Isocitrate/homoisocitrate dehydrogenase n=1 Tax=Deinococcus metallilatus TaxID=1211322 RepID=A0AAJ5F1T6_9DEIO|nr:isocitrate/isopropylmalate dehydrogenase family protein [Deinococcus metallilatus]MBB5296508.1 homoisocitrate dehydrogenase [Deinococcus metallilatus]QBY08461.1 isocitrate/isopropylmalate dehydrogenase family protein [Deinococcus metallilatus]RXJ11260.1 isocitrate/isopropylmalate dehydrogenase family protein [Deinococcus metallilatus]TLK24751.1 isocitrate/isopropylmalate dehydrogenase family protein [Deinococcus metallilatus]GMA17425.1 isocitrate dehydrogenase [Deinococcus metallilatus]